VSIRVKDGKIRYNKAYYNIGDTISSLSQEEEARLVSLGVAEYTEEAIDEETVVTNKNVKEAKELIESITSIDELNKILEEEIHGKNRTTIIQAISERIEILSQAL
jgi:hypothetical protein